ncbi:hypothetical protein M0802_001451 [Mischocyttarus mexicanus]|nr:hypothetical protein M0802_001451 [Mischocyttarus mexicanus]
MDMQHWIQAQSSSNVILGDVDGKRQWQKAMAKGNGKRRWHRAIKDIAISSQDLGDKSERTMWHDRMREKRLQELRVLELP